MALMYDILYIAVELRCQRDFASGGAMDLEFPNVRPRW